MSAMEAQEIQIAILRVDGPVWLPPGSPARVIFGAKDATAPSVTFLGGTAESPEDDVKDAGNALGRLTRSLPLWLAEQTEMRTAATGRAMLPWAVAREANGPRGFVVGAQPWADEMAVQVVLDPANLSDFVVKVHIDAEVLPWEATLVFLRSSNGSKIGELSAEFAPEDAAQALRGLADEVVQLLVSLGPATAPDAYIVPASLDEYLMRLEQLLMMRCASMDGESSRLPAGTEGFVDAVFQLSEHEGANIPLRLLVVETMGAVERVSPDAAARYRQRFDRLIVERPLAEVDSVFARA